LGEGDCSAATTTGNLIRLFCLSIFHRVLIMSRVPTDEAREQRITYEIIVDCYDEYEVAAGWYAYLADYLDFPFAAHWLTTGPSALDQVQVIGMADSEDCQTDILVEVRYRDGDLEDVFSIPLAELEPVDKNALRAEAMGDWQYWLDQGNGLVDPNEYEEY
jgi:hypothetical protein